MSKQLFVIALLGVCLAFSACDAADETQDTGTDTDADTDEDIDTGEIGDADDMVSGVAVTVHNRVKTILVVNWTQETAGDNVWLRYTFENDEWFTSHPKSADTGDHQEVILGVPGNTDVTFHIVVANGNQHAYTSAHEGTTGAVPASMPTPTVESYDASLASPNRFLFGSVENTPAQDDYYSGPFWLYIIDRQGRIVWYHSDLGNNPIIGFPRISRDNKYIYFGNRTPWDSYGNFTPTLVRMTLDWEFQDELEFNLWDNVDQTDDGSFIFNSLAGWGSNSWLSEYAANGTESQIWNVSQAMGDDDYSNTINWNPLDDTILMSFPHQDTVVEISRQTGQVVGQYGNNSGSYSFSPASWKFGFQHYANITEFGTLMVSTHMPNSNLEHAFVEFEIDRDNETLTEKWVYNDGGEWAEYMGEAHYVGNGSTNVLANYGTGGVIKEITQDKEVVWYVKWDASFANDDYNKLIGHCTLVDDLYAINEGL